MADLKISELTSVNLPLSGAEELALVQGGVTKKGTVSNLISNFQEAIDLIDLQKVTDVSGNTTKPILSNTSALVSETAIIGVNTNAGGGGGVEGYSQVGYGVFGDSVDGDGVGGEATNGNAISGISLNGAGGRFETINGSKIATFFTNNVEKAFVDSDGDVTANSFITTGGTGAGFLKDDGSVDTNSYLTGTSGWSLLGNAGTNPATNFIGNIDNKDLVFRTNNSERLRIYANGRSEGVFIMMRGSTNGDLTTNDMGMYNRTFNQNIRFVTNQGSIAFFTDGNISNGGSVETFGIRANNRVMVGGGNPTKTLDINGEARIRTLPAGLVSEEIVVANVNGDLRKVPKFVTVPATATSTGTVGETAYNSSFFYVCTATNTWVRTALTTF